MSPSALLSRISSRKVLCLTAALGLAVVCVLARTPAVVPVEREARSPARLPLYPTTQPAKNPERLTLILDAHRVVGWVSGSTNHAGAEAMVTVGKKTETVRIGEDNTFVWPYKVSKNTRAAFVVGDHKQTLTLAPREKLTPSVYFVADRSVYRPGQPFHFAAFLRQLDERGEFVPLTHQTVDVQLRRQSPQETRVFDEQGRAISSRKTTLANRWQLTSDDTGRISGDYTFAEADPLGDYEISIPDHMGSTRISLAEYRKTKLNLRISGEREGARLRLRFQAVDFMGKPLAAEKVQFTAEVVRNPKLPPVESLQGKEFIHAPASKSASLFLEELSEEEQLLAQADPDFEPLAGASATRQPVVVAQVQAELELAGKSEREYSLDIPKLCQEPGYSVVVHGIVTDTSGREQKKTQTISLKYLSDQIKLGLPRKNYVPNEAIEVSAKATDGGVQGKGVLVAMRLLHVPVVQDYGFNGRLHFGQLGQLGALGQLGQIGQLGQLGQLGQFAQIGQDGRLQMSNKGPKTTDSVRWQTFEKPEPERRRFVTAVGFEGDVAKLKLDEPGAYMLVAVLERPDGSKLKQEIGCIVEAPQERPTLTLQLDHTTLKTGAKLTGAIQSRYADAVVLLTLRDSTGLRFWKSFKLEKGMAEIAETLPAGLKYGCAVTIQYADSATPADPVQFASKLLHVEPTDRLLTIDTKMKTVYRPGDTVKIDLQVNRKEPIDLIVSVSDMSLLSIKPSQAIDIRNFYLADERAFENNARDLLQRRLAGVTVATILKRAERRLKQMKEEDPDPERWMLLGLLAAARTNQFSTNDIANLYILAGVKVKANLLYFGQIDSWRRSGDRNVRLIELLEVEKDGWRLHCSLLHDTFYLTGYHPTQLPNPWQQNALMNTMPGMQFGQLGQLGQLGQIGQLGQLGQVGQLGGMPNSRLMPPPPIRGTSNGAENDAGQTGSFIRQDFSDSAYWNAQVRTDADGKACVEFKVPDSYTNWQVSVVAVSKNMHVGQHKSAFSIAKPIMVSPIVPRLCTEGDTVQVGANIHNRTDKKQVLKLALKVDNGKVLGKSELTRTLEAGASDIVYWNFQAGSAGFTDLLMSGACEDGADGALKRLPVVRASAEEFITESGYCKDPILIKLPAGVDPKTASLELRLAPTLAADLVDTLDYLVEYPYGCVEQTMSRFLPAIKVAQILKQLKIEHPGLAKKLPGCVQGGIKRLLELQQPDGGWGWIGSSQTHEMMTPYALYGLLQAEKAGYTIGSSDAIQRGLARLKGFIDNRGQTSDWVYCVYVYGHRHRVTAEWWQVFDARIDQLSDYALALALDLALKQDQPKRARAFAERLIKNAQTTNGLVSWKTAGFSRWGDNTHEITAMAFKALVAYEPNNALLPGVLAYFNVTKNGNRWNSTKDTAMIVQALCDFLEQQTLDPTKARIPLTFRCNDGPEIRVTFENQTTTQKIRIPADQVKAGWNIIKFTEVAPWVVYRLVLRHWSAEREVKASAHGVEVEREYHLLDAKGKRVKQLQSGDAIPRGSFFESVVRARCLTTLTKYVLVENPRPCPCEYLPEDDRRFSRESTPYALREERQTHLAWHHEETNGRIEDVCVLHAELAGDYLIPPARVEFMYQTELQGHSGTFRLRVVDKSDATK